MAKCKRSPEGSISHSHFICIISHVSTDSKKIKKEEVVANHEHNKPKPDSRASTSAMQQVIAASTDIDVKLEARVSTTKTRANNPTNQTCACKGTSRAQELRLEPFLLSTCGPCGLVWSGLICIRHHTSASTPDPAFHGFPTLSLSNAPVLSSLIPWSEDCPHSKHGKDRCHRHSARQGQGWRSWQNLPYLTWQGAGWKMSTAVALGSASHRARISHRFRLGHLLHRYRCAPHDEEYATEYKTCEATYCEPPGWGPRSWRWKRSRERRPRCCKRKECHLQSTLPTGLLLG